VILYAWICSTSHFYGMARGRHGDYEQAADEAQAWLEAPPAA
jgi:hypothetical protein